MVWTAPSPVLRSVTPKYPFSPLGIAADTIQNPLFRSFHVTSWLHRHHLVILFLEIMVQHVASGHTPFQEGQGYGMKYIGLIGGNDWEVTQEYFRTINETVRSRLGGLASANCIVYSFNSQDMVNLQTMGAWHTAGLRLAMAAASLEHAGADILLIVSPAMHREVDIVRSAVRTPVLHIADAAATRLAAERITCAALIGNSLTGEEHIYAEPFTRNKIELLHPDQEMRELITKMKLEASCGQIPSEQGRRELDMFLKSLPALGVQALLMGCPGMKSIIDSRATALPIYNVLKLHALAAVDLVLS
jgi:aspartate racemase